MAEGVAYLPLLKERKRWMRPKRSFSIGDIVVIMDPVVPQGSWLMGKITQTYPDKKGFVCSGQLKTKMGQLDQPVTKICLVMEAEVS